MSNFKITIVLIPKILRNCQVDLYENMRVGIRWQKYIEEFTINRRDIQCVNIEQDANDSYIYHIECISPISFPTKYLEKGELVELLCTSDVLGVGKII